MTSKRDYKRCCLAAVVGMFIIFPVLLNMLDVTPLYDTIDAVLYRNNWNSYNLGDTVKLRADDKHRGVIVGRRHNLHRTPHSIAAEYIRTTNKSNDYDVLMDIVNKRMQKNAALQIPKDDELVIHLRTGDVIDDNPHSVHEMLANATKSFCCYYVKTLKYYERVIQFAKDKNLTNVVFVTGFHKTSRRDHSKSLEYLERLKSAFEENNLQTMNRLNLNPDDDFIFMANSRYFAMSGGGFSRIIAELVKRKNGTVYE